MFRRLRNAATRRSKSRDTRSTSTSTSASPGSNVPERSPGGDATPTMKNGRRRQRNGVINNNNNNTPSSNTSVDSQTITTPTTTTPVTAASPGAMAASSPTPEQQQFTPDATHRPQNDHLSVVTTPVEDMSTSNLLNDMQAQLEAKAPSLPATPVLPPTYSTASTGTSTTTTPRQVPQKQRSQRFSRKSLDSKEAAADSGCLPNRSRNAEPHVTTTPKAKLLRGSHHKNKTATTTTTTTEEDTENWNRITKEAAEWDRTGTQHFEKGEYDQAFLCYEKALTLKRKILKPGDSPEKATSEASMLASVATSINNMTYLRQRAGQATADETMAAYLQSLQMKREILGPHHLSVGKTLNNIGSVFYLKREYEPALSAYLNAAEIMEQALGEAHLDVGTVLSNIGDVYFAMGHKQDAKEYYRKALDVRWGALGPSDPKVVRLMEQLAFLETGKQPSRDLDDLSDSEDEEYACADRLRHDRFQEEVRVLQEELAEDMKFFDLLERKMAIDMVRDKTRMFRKMRQVTDLTLDDLMDVSESCVTDQSESEISTTAAPVATGKETQSVPLLKVGLKELPEMDGVDSSFLADTSDMLPPAEHEIPHSSATNFLERNNAALMSKEQRAEALRTVRYRLATLRASREAQQGGDIDEKKEEPDQTAEEPQMTRIEEGGSKEENEEVQEKSATLEESEEDAVEEIQEVSVAETNGKVHMAQERKTTSVSSEEEKIDLDEENEKLMNGAWHDAENDAQDESVEDESDEAFIAAETGWVPNLDFPEEEVEQTSDKDGYEAPVTGWVQPATGVLAGGQ